MGVGHPQRAASISSKARRGSFT